MSAEVARGFHVQGPFEEQAWLAWDVEIEPAWRAFAGHFPNHPILPAIGHLFLVRQLLESVRGRGACLTVVDRFRLMSPILPGATLRVRIEIHPAPAISRFKIDLSSGRASEASFQWQPANPS